MGLFLENGRKRNRFLWYFVLFALWSEIGAKRLNCSNTAKCFCLNHHTELEFHCESVLNGTNNIGQLVVHYQPEKEIQFDCHRSGSLDLGVHLPKLDFVPTAIIQECPLPTLNFSQVFTEVGINKLVNFKFDYRNGEKNNTITRKHFYNLKNLKTLSLNSNNRLYIDADTFGEMPNLEYLDVRDSSIDLNLNIFEPLKRLESLDLLDNGIVQIEDGTFNSLSTVTSLNLWRNKIGSLSENTFYGLLNLKSLELGFNQISSIHKDAFQGLQHLEELSLISNKLTTLPKEIFQNNFKLKVIRISYNPLETLRNGIFSELPSLQIVDLNSGNLHMLSEDTFRYSTNLQHINLSRNRLTNIPSNLFLGLSQIIELDLSKNLIQNVPLDLFTDLISLQTLHLEFNSISTLHNELFINNMDLVFVNMAHNNYSMSTEPALNPFARCDKIEYLILSHNLLNDTMNLMLTKGSIRVLDLSYNLIKELKISDLQRISKYTTDLDLSNNRIETVNFMMSKHILQNFRTKLRVNLNGNFVRCDCRLLDFVLFIKQQQFRTQHLEFIVNDLTCSTNSNTYLESSSISVKNIHPEELTCSIQELNEDYTNCPKNCSCAFAPYLNALVFNCSGRNLDSIPKLHQPEPNNNFAYNHTELYLDNNLLTDLSDVDQDDLNNVTKLSLSNNRLTDLWWIPQSLDFLAVDNNSLTSMENNVLQQLVNTSVLLSGNPWSCDCNLKSLNYFLRQNTHNILDLKEIKCNETDVPVFTLTTLELCSNRFLTAIYFSVFTVTLLVACIFVTLTFYYRYQQGIKAWLYINNLCLFWVTEEELDKDKPYDAFICFSQRDDDLVSELITMLEDGPNPYKICLHYRNWIPGEAILQQVMKSVNDSRRTIVVLSENFLKSAWSQLEFRTAHTQGMMEGRARVIVVLYDDTNSIINDLDDELKTYLQNTTYLKWGDPFFYEKLQYAMPHRNASYKKTLREYAKVRKTSTYDETHFN